MSNTSQLESGSPTILSIDGYSLLYRAFFALPDTIRDQTGRPVNAIHGFISMLARLLNEHQPTAVVVAYDSPWPTLRHAVFPQYKANRTALPEALLGQVPLLQRLLQRIGVPVYSVPGYEGDDILASLAEWSAAQQVVTLIVTGDRDLFQLVRDPWIRVLYTRRGVGKTQVLDETGVNGLVGVPPSRYADLAALRGDPADNISGISGIGEKGAVAIINKAPSLEDLYENLGRLPKDLGQKLMLGRDMLFANRELLRPLPTVPVTWDRQDLSLRIDPAEAKKALGELGLSKACDALLSAQESSQSKPTVSSTGSIGDLLLHTRRLCVVSCSAEKTAHEAQARDLYVSSRFKKARRWAELAAERWYILSAKHGLVSPESPLHPYDVSLQDATTEEREAWADLVMSQLQNVLSPSDRVFLLADDIYASPVVKRLSGTDCRIARPFEGMAAEGRLEWLNRALEIGPASGDLEDFYEILYRLAHDTGGPTCLAEADQRRWPARGVYFFFEPREHRLGSMKQRVVRVGTHAVSTNSKATLWNRLRTHRGVSEGGGNHRSSIFRSHVGTAILRRDSRVSEFPNWGDQSAGSPEVRAVENELEKLVSAVISEMQIVCLEIRDDAGPRSDRAYLERNSIALLANVGIHMDPASDTWLGRSSAHPCVRKSGLWNVNYVDEPSWDPAFLDVFDYYARATVGKAPFLKGSVAPSGWWNRTRSTDQMTFQWSEENGGARRD